MIRARLKMTRNRRRPAGYRRDFPDRYIPDTTFHLCATDRQWLQDAGRPDIPPLPAGTRARRILEHLLADLSRASPRMEGNTCGILETERLIRFGREAVGKDRKEAVMIFSQEEAIQHVVDTLDTVTISLPDLRNIHTSHAPGFIADRGMAGRLRRMPVGITDSSYRPLGDRFEIEEEFGILIEKATAVTDSFAQSFFLLVHIPCLPGSGSRLTLGCD